MDENFTAFSSPQLPTLVIYQVSRNSRPFGCKSLRHVTGLPKIVDGADKNDDSFVVTGRIWMKISQHLHHLNCQLWLFIKHLKILDCLAVNPSAMSLDFKDKHLYNIMIVNYVPCVKSCQIPLPQA